MALLKIVTKVSVACFKSKGGGRRGSEIYIQPLD